MNCVTFPKHSTVKILVNLLFIIFWILRILASNKMCLMPIIYISLLKNRLEKNCKHNQAKIRSISFYKMIIKVCKKIVHAVISNINERKSAIICVKNSFFFSNLTLIKQN